MVTRRETLSRLWVAVSVAYGGLRALLVWRYLSGYGVNPWWFAIVELGSSVGYGWASARLVLAVVDRRWASLRLLAPATTLAYVAPDAYVFATVGRLPDGLWRTLVTIVAVSFALAAAALVREVRRGRAAGGSRS